MSDLGATVVIRPGDVLVLPTATELSEAQIKQLKVELAEYLPGVKLLVISNVTGLAAFRPSPD